MGTWEMYVWCAVVGELDSADRSEFLRQLVATAPRNRLLRSLAVLQLDE